MSDPTLEQKITAVLRDGIIAQTQIDDYDAPYVSTEHYSEPDLLVDGKVFVAHLAALVAAVVRDEWAENDAHWSQDLDRLDAAVAERDEARAALNQMRVNLIRLATRYGIPPDDLYAELAAHARTAEGETP